MPFIIKPATPDDVPTLFALIKELAEYEKLAHEVVGTTKLLHDSLFGPRPVAEAVLGFMDDKAVSMAIFFHNYSTFLTRPGLYLEDLYVKSAYRGQGLGRAMFIYLAQLAVSRQCPRFEWQVLDWNEPAIKFYDNLGAQPKSAWLTYQLTGEALARLAENVI